MLVLVQIRRVLKRHKLVFRTGVAKGGAGDVRDGFEGAEEYECVDVGSGLGLERGR